MLLQSFSSCVRKLRLRGSFSCVKMAVRLGVSPWIHSLLTREQPWEKSGAQSPPLKSAFSFWFSELDSGWLTLNVSSRFYKNKMLCRNISALIKCYSEQGIQSPCLGNSPGHRLSPSGDTWVVQGTLCTMNAFSPSSRRAVSLYHTSSDFFMLKRLNLRGDICKVAESEKQW